MLGAGFAFAIAPALSRIHDGDPEALAAAMRRHAGFFNAHPYLAAVAIGAVARLETEGTDPDTAERLKTALVSPLGTLGDRLVWARWRPICALSALLLFLAGAPWWAAVLAFLTAYNVVHLALRVWAFRVGWRQGTGVGRALLGSPLRRVPDRLTIPLAVLGGALLPPLAGTFSGEPGIGASPAFAVALLAAFGLWRPELAGRIAAVGLVAISLALVGLGLIS
jgi:PTS system mannose-specific IID component